jgi:Tfp pilus assembly protein PilV
VSEAALIDLRGSGRGKLAARLREETGLGLIELLISLLVLNLGIFATMGAFTSGAVAIRNASRVSTASALADKNIEAFRDMSYSSSSFAVGTTTANQTGADGLTYSVTTAITSGSQLTTGTYQGSTAVKVVTLTIRDGGPTGRVLYGPASTTFSYCAQDLTATACNS